ncbi:MAG: 30S ribosome-binding factor RbfA [Clostridiales bacterium]|nr:30S ribosome-binding factor RbfA [Clostridiales bacterium]
MAQYRQNRIAEEIKKNLDRIIREELDDPRVNSTFSITRVEPSRDLRYAKVYVSVLEEDKLEGMIKALKGAAGLLRHALGSTLTVRHTPELNFIGDKNIAYGLHIAGVLKQVMGDGAHSPQDENNQPE